MKVKSAKILVLVFLCFTQRKLHNTHYHTVKKVNTILQHPPYFCFEKYVYLPRPDEMKMKEKQVFRNFT